MNEENIQNIARELSKLPQGYIPSPIFDQIGRLTALTAIEFIPLRTNGDEIEVLLYKRSTDDTYWPNTFHTPGTIMRTSDISFEDAYARLFNEELKSEPLPFKFIGNEVILSNRGRTILFKYVLDVTGLAVDGEFYNINSIPQNTITEQKYMIKEAATHFSQYIT